MNMRKKIAATATAIAVVGGAGVATAWWTSTGTGANQAKVGTSTAWLVENTTATGQAGLTPGGTTQTISYKITNPNTGHQKLQDVEIKVAGTGTDGAATVWSSGTCNKDDFQIGDAVAGAPYNGNTEGVDLAANGVHTNTVVIALVNNSENQDDCKGVNVPLYISAS